MVFDLVHFADNKFSPKSKDQNYLAFPEAHSLRYSRVETYPAYENYPDEGERWCASQQVPQKLSTKDWPVKRLILGILVSAMLALPATGEDLNGWHEAKWGMTPDQVQKVLNYPTIEADLAKLCSKECNEGAVLELDDYELNGLHFTVRFWFSKPDKHLQAVSLFAKQLSDKDNPAFSEMKRYLETAYGAPKSTILKRGFFEITWQFESTMVTFLSNTRNHLTILYEKRSDKESG
jgi:hypothetical protein